MATESEKLAFIEALGALAAADMLESGILASLTLAQGILESNWGTSGLTVNANALFGVKATASWKGGVYNAKTKEFSASGTATTMTATFRAYDSWAESVADHSALLTGSKRYGALVGERDYQTACREIQKAGYATDPDYAAQLIALIERYHLTDYDSLEPLRESGGAEEPAADKTEDVDATENAARTDGAEDMKRADGTAEEEEKRMRDTAFLAKLRDVVEHYQTLYVMGCYGAPLTGDNVALYRKNHAYNQRAARSAMIQAAGDQDPPVFGFDCSCLIKGILWGWSGDAADPFGGAVYESNGVPDLNADAMIKKCRNVSAKFDGILPGEAVWMSGHIGVYAGDGMVIECSPSFENGVQVTECRNLQKTEGLNGRNWKKHGKLPWVDYSEEAAGESAVVGQTSDEQAVDEQADHRQTDDERADDGQVASGQTTVGQSAENQSGGGQDSGSADDGPAMGDSGSGLSTALEETEDTASIRTPDDLAIGDTVLFTGVAYYLNAVEDDAMPCEPGPAKVTAIAAGQRHPYYLLASGEDSTVHGWVDADDIQP